MTHYILGGLTALLWLVVFWPTRWIPKALRRAFPVDPGPTLGRAIPVDSTTPQVGYKRAWLCMPDEGTIAFRGVASPHLYTCDEEHVRNTVGFHAYYSLENALKHTQDANIYLEVLGTGKVGVHELGYTSTHQRVLQLVIGDCGGCESNQAVGWIRVPHKKEGASVELYCEPCAEEKLELRDLSELESIMVASSPVPVAVSTLKPIPDSVALFEATALPS